MSPNFAGVFTLFIWTSSALLVTFVNRLPPLQLTAITWAVAALCLLAYFLLMRQPVLKHFKRPWQDYVFVTSGIGVYTSLFYIAFKYAPAFEANALNYLWPLFLMFFMTTILKTKLTAMNAIGMLAGFAGCLALIASKQHETLTVGAFGIGHVIAILAAAIWGYYSALAREKDYPVQFLLPVFLLCAVLTYGVHLAFEESMAPTAMEWSVAISIGVLRLGYVTWDYAMRHGNQLMLSSLSYLTPLGSTLVLMAGGHGAASPAIALAGALIIGGCIVVNWDGMMKYLRGRRS